MPSIQPLPTALVNQIAAGEVLERPSSAVKEMIENSLDAGASRIVVELVEGGRELIRIIDDGCGIVREELPLAIAPHATSKLQSADDLFRVRTLGFRGEALASIAGVSDFRLISRPYDQEIGASISVKHGFVGDVRDHGCPPGTQIEVRDLFGNVPVRRKFLKSKQTELGHASEAIARLALAFPGVGFVLRHNDRVVIDRPAGIDLKDSIAILCGSDLGDALLPVEAEFDGCRVHGYAADPRIDRPNSRSQYFFINNRWFRDRSLGHAVTEAYRGLVMTGRYPVTFLFIEAPPDQVDVNVHPQKAEVRFLDPHRMFSLVLHGLRRRLLASDLTARLRAPEQTDESKEVAPDFQLTAPPQELTPSLWTVPPPRSENAPPATPPINRWETPPPRSVDAMPTFRGVEVRPREPDAYAPQDLPPIPMTRREPLTTQAPTNAPPPVSTLSNGPPKPGRAFQLHNAYIVLETNEGMLLIDQHALHERILYEELKRRYLAGSVECQELLLPEPVELPPAQVGLLLENRELFDRLGLRIGEFGDRCVLVQSQPALLSKLPVGELVRDLAASLESAGAAPRPEALLDGVLAMTACKAAVKAGDPLAPEEIDALLARRHSVEDSHHCPHGRPTVLRFTLHELERQFRRV